MSYHATAKCPCPHSEPDANNGKPHSFCDLSAQPLYKVEEVSWRNFLCLLLFTRTEENESGKRKKQTLLKIRTPTKKTKTRKRETAFSLELAAVRLLLSLYTDPSTVKVIVDCHDNKPNGDFWPLIWWDLTGTFNPADSLKSYLHFASVTTRSLGLFLSPSWCLFILSAALPISLTSNTVASQGSVLWPSSLLYLHLKSSFSLLELYHTYISSRKLSLNLCLTFYTHGLSDISI